MGCYLQRQSHETEVYVSNSTNTTLFGHNQTDVPADNNILDDTADTNDLRDTIFVILAFLAITGCFIYMLCKCSNSCGSLHHLDLDDIDDNGDSNHINSLMMIEMGDFANLDAIHPLDVVSVDLTLDQELSEDERSIQQFPIDNNGDGTPR